MRGPDIKSYIQRLLLAYLLVIALTACLPGRIHSTDFGTITNPNSNDPDAVLKFQKQFQLDDEGNYSRFALTIANLTAADVGA